MKILKILAACFVVLVLSVFFVFELIFSRSVDKSLSAYAEENITSDSVDPLSGDDPDPSIIDYHWDLSGFDQYNLNLLNGLTNGSSSGYGTVYFQSVNLISGNLYTVQVYSSDISYCELKNSQGQVVYYLLNNSSGVGTYSFTADGSTYSLNFYTHNSITWWAMLVKGTYTAETMPAYQPNLKYIFTTAFTYGYKDGYNTGYDSGLDYGYNLGYISGYDTGYSYGRNSQISEGLFKNPLDVFLQPISNFLNTDIFGSFSIGDGFTIAFFVMIALIFIKMFAGG